MFLDNSHMFWCDSKQFKLMLKAGLFVHKQYYIDRAGSLREGDNVKEAATQMIAAWHRWLDTCEELQTYRDKAAVLGITLKHDDFDFTKNGDVRLSKARDIINGVYTIPFFVKEVGPSVFANVENDIRVRNGVLKIRNNSTILRSIADMFACFDIKGIHTIDMSEFDSRGIESFFGLFYGAHIKHVNLTNLCFDRVKDIAGMFSFSHIEGLHFPTVDMSRCGVIDDLCSNCRYLRYFDGAGMKNMQNIIAATHIFYNCSSLVSLDLSNLKFETLVSAHDMFKGCSNIQSVKLEYFAKYTRDIESRSAFEDCPKLKEVIFVK